MKPESVKTRIRVLIAFALLVFGMLAVSYYLNQLTSEAHDRYNRIIRSQKAFSDLIFAESSLLRKGESSEEFSQRYQQVGQSCNRCHHPEYPALLGQRRRIFETLQNTSQLLSQTLIQVHEELKSLIDSVKYIHAHHMAHLENLLHRGAIQQDYDVGESFERSPVKGAPELLVLKSALAIYTWLLAIADSFQQVQLDGDIREVRLEFTKRFQSFMEKVNRFESYSLDAQDGILVEELLIQGRRFERAFGALLGLKEKQAGLYQRLDQNRRRLLAVLEHISQGIQEKNRRLKNNITLLQIGILLLTPFLILRIIRYGRATLKGLERTLDETRRIRQDLSYRIPRDAGVSREFGGIFETLNAMAEQLEEKIAELQRARDGLEEEVNRRTLELAEMVAELEREVAERKQAESALEKSREKYRQIFVNVSDIWFHHDLNGVFIETNLSFKPEWGYCQSEVIGANLRDFIPDTDHAGVAAYLERVAREKKAEGVFRCLTKAGQEKRYLEYRSELFEDENGDLAVRGSARDITERRIGEKERKRLESQIQQAEKMQAIGTLAGGIAHDFNNILSPILGYSELALGKVEPDSPLYRYLEQIRRAGERASDLVGQILTFSRKRERERVPLLIQPLIKEALKLLRASLPTTIEMQNQLPKQCGPVLADPTQIHQIVMNLCTNAYHAMKDNGGLLEVLLEEVELPDEKVAADIARLSGKYACLTVRDSGVGMTPDLMRRIFNPYFTTKPPGQGTGLGLSVVRDIVESYGGKMGVESAPGQGSRFSVFLPCIEARPREKRELEDQPLEKGNESVLFVDDEVQVVHMARQMLEFLGYQVSAHTESQKALECFLSDPDRFDLVITDQTMPRMTGLELAEQVHERRPRIPVILCSGYIDRIREKIPSHQVQATLTKPFALGKLSRCLRQVLDQKGAAGQEPAAMEAN